MKSIDPATGAVVQTYSGHTDAEIQNALERAVAAQRAWRELRFAERAGPLRRAAAILRRDKEQHVTLMAREMGKPIEQGRAEIEKCALACDYFAEHAEKFLVAEHIATDATRSYVLFQPLGVLLAIMPWNFPFWQVFRAAAPSLMAGNAVALKHASNVSGCALAIAEIFREAALPANLFTVLLVSSQRVEKLIANPAIAAVTLTGSTEAGKSVAAGAGTHLKKTGLGTGG